MRSHLTYFLARLIPSYERHLIKYDIESQITSTIAALIQQGGFKAVDRTQSQIILDQDFRISWRRGIFQRGGDILAAVNITELPEFGLARTTLEELSEDMKNFYTVLNVLRSAVIEQFETQSPEFRRLTAW